MKLRAEIELDLSSLDSYSKEEYEWFIEHVLLNPSKNGELILHSNEIGDTLGSIKVLKIKPILNLKKSDKILEPVRRSNGDIETFMPRIHGRVFKCHCGCNVFHKPDKTRPQIYECNACGEWYLSD